MQISAHVEAISAVHGIPTLALADQSWDWRRRWEAAEREFAELVAPAAGALSAETIRIATYRLRSFFVNAYHIKDALTVASASTGVSAHAVENAINTEPPLALLADLANLVKHGKLTKPPRSGDTPRITGVKGAGQSTGDWRLQLDIEHRGVVVDGLDVARQALEAWKRALTGWGLL